MENKIDLKELEIGSECKSRQGKVLTLVDKKSPHWGGAFPFDFSDGIQRNSNGKAYGDGDSCYDIVEILPLEQPETVEEEVEEKGVRKATQVEVDYARREALYQSSCQLTELLVKEVKLTLDEATFENLDKEVELLKKAHALSLEIYNHYNI